MNAKSRRLVNPNVRDDIEVAIRDLTDIEMQKREWIEGEEEQQSYYWDSLYYNVLIDLFQNNICLEATNEIGSVFYNEEEAKKLQEFSLALNNLINEIGTNQPYAAYIENPKWLDMIKDAKQIYIMMREADQNNNFLESFSTFNRQRIKDNEQNLYE